MLLTGRAGESESERSAAGGARGRLARRLVAQASDRRRAAVIVELVSPAHRAREDAEGASRR